MVADEGGYLIEQDQRWKVPPAAMATRPAEDEVQEITIEMREENKPFGTLRELLSCFSPVPLN